MKPYKKMKKKLNKFISFFYAFLSGLKINRLGKLATGDVIVIFMSFLKGKFHPSKIFKSFSVNSLGIYLSHFVFI